VRTTYIDFRGGAPWRALREPALAAG